jgi:hypothetical protein
MKEGEPPARIPFEILRVVQSELERRGYYYLAVEQEHIEGLVTAPIAARLRGQIKRRGFQKVAGHMILTFSGYDRDPREIQEVPEIRAYFEQLDAEVTELPALLAFLPEMGFNGPGIYLMILGEISETIHHPEQFGYDVQVLGAQRIIDRALHRIRQTATTYKLRHNDRIRLEQTFLTGTRFRFPLR